MNQKVVVIDLQLLLRGSIRRNVRKVQLSISRRNEEILDC